MAQLLVRNLDDAVKSRLKRRAVRNGRSMEEEVRDILRVAVNDEPKPNKGLGTAIAERFKGLRLDRDEFPKLKIRLRVPKFD
jgi:plasmid stability protein